MDMKKTGLLFCGLFCISGGLFAETPDNMNIDGLVANDMQKVLTMGAENKAQTYKKEEAGLDLLQQNQNAWGTGNSFLLPTSSDPVQQVVQGTQQMEVPPTSSVYQGGAASIDRSATGLGSSSKELGGGGNNAGNSKFDADSQEKIKKLEADVAEKLKNVQDMEKVISDSSNLSPFIADLQALSTALDTLEKVKQLDPDSVSVDVKEAWGYVDAMCSNTTKANVAHNCKQVNRGADDKFLNDLVLQDDKDDNKDDDEKDDDKKDDDKKDDGDTEEPDSAMAAVRAACGGSFGGNNGSPSLMAKLGSGACAKALKDNPDISAKVGVDKVLGSLQKWRNFAQGPRKNLLMLSGIGIERLYEIGVVVYSGRNQEDVMGLNTSPAVAVQQEHITSAQIASPEALAAANASIGSIPNIKIDKPMTSVHSYTD